MRRDDRNWVTVDDEEYFENLLSLVEVSLKNVCQLLKFIASLSEIALRKRGRWTLQ